MHLKNMALSEYDKKEMSQESVVDRPKYDYGLTVHISEEMYERLGLSEAPDIGECFMMLAKVEVKDIHQNKGADDRMKVSMGLQITDMALQAKEYEPEEKKDPATALYGEGEY